MLHAACLDGVGRKGVHVGNCAEAPGSIPGGSASEGKAFPVPVFTPFIKAGSRALHAVYFLAQGSHGEEEGSGGVMSESWRAEIFLAHQPAMYTRFPQAANAQACQDQWAKKLEWTPL